MPWWQTRLYEEGLVEEFAASDGEDAHGRSVELVPAEAMGVQWA